MNSPPTLTVLSRRCWRHRGQVLFLWNSLMLAQALGQISDRERYIFFARALEKRSFDDLSSELGMGYKGVAAVYYRAIQKLKKEL